MLKKICFIFILVVTVCVATVASADCYFSSILTDLVYIADIPVDAAAIVYLYEANSFMNMTKPGIRVVEVEKLAKQLNIQFRDIRKYKHDAERISEFWISPHFCAYLIGDPIESADLQITLNEHDDVLASIPFNCNYSAHAQCDDDASLDQQCQYSLKNETYAELLEKKVTNDLNCYEGILDANLLRSTLVEEMLQFAMFSSCLYPQMPKHQVMMAANAVPMFKICKFYENENQLCWEWNHWRLGKIVFSCEFVQGTLSVAAFQIDHVLSTELNQVFVSRLDNPPVTGNLGIVFSPFFNVDLTRTWMNGLIREMLEH